MNQKWQNFLLNNKNIANVKVVKKTEQLEDDDRDPTPIFMSPRNGKCKGIYVLGQSQELTGDSSKLNLIQNKYKREINQIVIKSPEKSSFQNGENNYNHPISNPNIFLNQINVNQSGQSNEYFPEYQQIHTPNLKKQESSYRSIQQSLDLENKKFSSLNGSNNQRSQNDSNQQEKQIEENKIKLEKKQQQIKEKIMKVQEMKKNQRNKLSTSTHTGFSTNLSQNGINNRYSLEQSKVSIKEQQQNSLNSNNCQILDQNQSKLTNKSNGSKYLANSVNKSNNKEGVVEAKEYEIDMKYFKENQKWTNDLSDHGNNPYRNPQSIVTSNFKTNQKDAKNYDVNNNLKKNINIQIDQKQNQNFNLPDVGSPNSANKYILFQTFQNGTESLQQIEQKNNSFPLHQYEQRKSFSAPKEDRLSYLKQQQNQNLINDYDQQQFKEDQIQQQIRKELLGNIQETSKDGDNSIKNNNNQMRSSKNQNLMRNSTGQNPLRNSTNNNPVRNSTDQDPLVKNSITKNILSNNTSIEKDISQKNEQVQNEMNSNIRNSKSSNMDQKQKVKAVQDFIQNAKKNKFSDWRKQKTNQTNITNSSDNQSNYQKQ